MSPGDFLRAVWPGDGIYCLATPFQKPDGGMSYAQRTFDNVSDAVSFVLREKAVKDMYFAVHTLKEASVWNPEKINKKTGKPGANETRTHSNMKAARCFYFDLDVGPSVEKYASQHEALTDLVRFGKLTKLPRPMIASSGGGLHVYWLLADALDSLEWRDHAVKLKQLARHHGLKADPAVTSDISRVLRVAGTLNFKDRKNPREVKVLSTATETGSGAFIKMLDTAVIEAGIEVQQPPKFDAASLLGSNLDREWEGPPVSLKALLMACGQMKRLALAKGEYSEREWYAGVVGVGRFLEDGHRRVQQMSQGHRGYSVAATAAKIKQHEDYRDQKTGKKLGPTSCRKLMEESGTANEEICIGCPFVGRVHGPLGAARFKDPAPAPVLTELVGSTVVETKLPDAPPPFARMNGGGIAVSAKNADGNMVEEKIYDYDLFPVRRLSNPTQGIEQQVWRVILPREEPKDFTLDADMLYDSRKFVTAIANQGIYPNKGHIPTLQEYMVAYIAQLQKLVDADAQCNHLGWADDYTRFILPDKVIAADGTARSAQLSLGAQRASAQVHKKGSIHEQIRLLKFYDHRQYLPNQFYIVGGLAAAVFHLTGHHGVIINASGDAGASKSTSLYTAASLWGQPELYPINGTNNGATVRGRNERVTVLANLPVCVDEITHMPVKDAIDLAMSITQPGHRIRLETSGVERASVGSYKSTIMLATGNNSLHGLLSTDNAAGTAGSMRVFEIRFEANKVHKKHEADEYLHALKENYGHIGEAFILHVIKNLESVKRRIRAKTKEIDLELGIQSSERFWSAAIATILVSCEIANELGLLSYDPVAMKQWVIDVQVPQMRGVVKDEYSDPLAILGDYLEQINSNILVMEKVRPQQGNLYNNLQRKPMGAMLAHYDTDEQMLYVLKKGFKDYCTRIGGNSIKILDDLHMVRDGSRIVANRNTRRTLGAGTEFAKAQSWCFSINMAHPDVSGAVDLTLVTGGPVGGSMAGADQKAPGLQLVT